jgi:hypothetical protein
MVFLLYSIKRILKKFIKDARIHSGWENSETGVSRLLVKREEWVGEPIEQLLYK